MRLQEAAPGMPSVVSRYAEARIGAAAVIAAGWPGGAMLTSACERMGRAHQHSSAAPAHSKISIALSKLLSRILPNRPKQRDQQAYSETST